MKHLSLFVCALLCTALASAQNASTGGISGRLIDEATKRPLQFVNVVVLRSHDSTIATGMVSDKQGKYNLDNIPFGTYAVRFSHIGYHEQVTRLITLSELRPTADLGTVALTETMVNLDDVLVTSQKALVNSAIDRKVFNVSQDIMSKAGSVSELLQNIPSVQVDIDGNFMLRGSADVLILINGRNSPLMGKSRAEVLQQMQANSIEKIEVITNPSAKYRPDGTSGIINLVMKKSENAAMSGSATVNGGTQDRMNGNARLNYKPGDLALHGSYSIRHDNRNRINSDAREQTNSAGVLTFYKDDATGIAAPLSHSIVLGLQYEFSDQTSASIAGNYFRNGMDRRDHSSRSLNSALGAPLSRYTYAYSGTESEEETGVEMSFDHQFDGEDHSLKLEMSASREPENEDANTKNSWVFPLQPDEREKIIRSESQNRTQVKLDYTRPFNEDSRLEFGYEGEFSRNDLDSRIDRFDPVSARFVVDTTVTNHFLYDENLHAIYATVQQSFGRFGLMGGLRLERSMIDTRLEGLDSAATNDYSSAYPTLHLSFALSESSELQLNYSRRVHRPHGDDLNPFPEYQDSRNLSAGNPRLKPEYIHSVEFGFKAQNDLLTMIPSIFYRYTYNRFTTITRQLNDSTLLTTRQNLSTDRSAGVELVGSSSIGSFSANGSVNAFLNWIDASNLGYSTDKSVWTWSSAVTMAYRLSGNSMAQLNGNFNSARLTPQGRYQPSWVVNAGVRYEVVDGRLSLTATISDIFKSLRREMRVETPTLRQTLVNTRDARVLYLGLTYYFGSQPKRQREDQIRYDDALE